MPRRATLSLSPNRGYELAIFGAISSSISGRLKCANIVASLAAIRARKMVAQIGGGLAAIIQEFPEIADQRSGINGPLFLAPNLG